MIQANGTLYKINALEQRIEKQGTGANTPSGTRQFVYDEMGHLIGEYDPVSGAAQIEHVWLGDIPVAAIKGGQIYYVYPDHLGTPRAITNAANQTVWYWNYDEPFGKTAANENPSGTGTFAYNLRFPGQYFDSETGLHYNWHRDYDPEIGKYAQSDPIGLGGGLNTYSYVEGNPLRYTDPRGLTLQDVLGVWGDVMGSFSDLRPRGAVSCGVKKPGNAGETSFFTGNMFVAQSFCDAPCLSRADWEELFFTLFHEGMHSSDPPWRAFTDGPGGALSDNHRGIYNRENYERGYTARGRIPKPIWGTPRAIPVNKEALYQKYRDRTPACCEK
jgi:RHS repeat-associated protein